jgi:hypothetical protein
VSAASLAVKLETSMTMASAGMMSPVRTRKMSPGTTSSAGMVLNAPSRLTSAVSATDALRASAAFAARPSWNASNPTETTMIVTMIAALAPSPVTAEMKAANNSTRSSGSRRRRRMAPSGPARFEAASAFRPVAASRRAASSVLKPSAVALRST